MKECRTRWWRFHMPAHVWVTQTVQPTDGGAPFRQKDECSRCHQVRVSWWWLFAPRTKS